MITVAFRSGYWDTVRAVRSINHARPRVRIVKRLSYVCLGVTVVLAMLRFPAEWTALALFLPAIVLPLLWLLPLHAAWLIWRKAPSWQAERRFTFTPTGIDASGMATEGHLRWSAITRVSETGRHFVLFTSGQAGYAIPKKALPDEATVSAVRALLLEHAGKGVDAPTTGMEERLPPGAVVVEFEWEPRELYRALRAATRHGPARWPIFVALAVLAWWLGAGEAVRQWRAGGWQATNGWSLAVALLPIACTAAAIPLTAAYAAWSLRRGSPMHAGVQRVVVAAAGIRTRGSLYSGSVGWEALVKAVETADFFLLYVAKAQAVIVPKRGLDPDQLRRVRATIAANFRSAALFAEPVRA
jgi:hypothetical protein